MTNENLNIAQNTWNNIDINKVRSVAWSSIAYFRRKNIQRSHDKKINTSEIHNLLNQKIAIENKDSLCGCVLLCGDMESERGFFEYSQGGVKFNSVDGYDISDVSLQRHRPFNSLKFNPVQTNCNDLILPDDKYDLIVACHAVHHVYNLGNLFYQANRALKPHGLIYLYEWIGPNYLQIPLFNRFFATLLLLILFPSSAVRTTHMNKVKGIYLQDPPSFFDPSEACNSTELVLQYEKYFKPISSIKHGGLLYPMFEGIAQNIAQEKFVNKIKLHVAYYCERLLTATGLIKPLFMSSIGNKINFEQRNLR